MVQTNESLTILQSCVCLTLRCSYLGNNRKVSLASVKEEMEGRRDLDERAVRATMKLVAQKALRGPNRVIGQAKSYLRSRAVQAHHVFGEGTFLLALPLLSQVVATLREKQVELEAEARLVADGYAREVEAQRTRLGHLFNPTLYLTPAQVAQAWGFEFSFVEFAAPERLKTVDEAIYRETVDRLDAQATSAFHEYQLVVREAALEFAREFSRRLAPDKSGQTKVIKATSLLADLRDFITQFPLRDATNDDALAEVVARLDRATAGLAPRDLNDDASVRAAVLKTMRGAAAQLDGLVVTGRRAISLGPLRPSAAA